MNVVDWIHKAYSEGWAIGQYNLSTLEVLQGIVDAANEANAPALIGVSMGTMKHIELPYLPGLVQGAKAAARVPIFFHLDHGDSFESIQHAIAAGFDSVMIDASRLNLEDNIELVRRVVAYGHERGVGVEAQIGETWDEEIGDFVETRTDPNGVRAYVDATGVDYLAISFGNTPGRLDGQAPVDVALIRDCAAAAAPVPIVLHGGSSIPDEAMKRGISLGAAKVNIDTAIRKTVTDTLRSQYAAPSIENDPRKVFRIVRRAVKNTVIEKITLLGSASRAE